MITIMPLLAYNVDLIKPDSTVRKSVFNLVQTDEKKEPINDIALEAQFLLDSTYHGRNLYAGF